MKGFLLDENLITRLTFAPSMQTCHARDFGGNPTDGELWELARVRHWVIITKDADFSERILVSKAPPWIVRLRFGNMRRREFHRFRAGVWPKIESLRDVFVWACTRSVKRSRPLAG